MSRVIKFAITPERLSICGTSEVALKGSVLLLMAPLSHNQYYVNNSEVYPLRNEPPAPIQTQEVSEQPIRNQQADGMALHQMYHRTCLRPDVP